MVLEFLFSKFRRMHRVSRCKYWIDGLLKASPQMEDYIFKNQFSVLVQNANEVDDSKRHDIQRHRIEKVHVWDVRPLLYLK